MVIIVMGVSGSGKTTVGRLLAHELGSVYADADDFHPPANVQQMRGKQPLTDDDRRPWLQNLARQVRRWLEERRDGVLACSALTARSRAMLGVDNDRVRLVYLKGSFDLIHSRIAARKDHFMPADLLVSQFQTLEEPAEAIVLDVGEDPEAIVRRAVDALRRGA